MTSTGSDFFSPLPVRSAEGDTETSSVRLLLGFDLRTVESVMKHPLRRGRKQGGGRYSKAAQRPAGSNKESKIEKKKNQKTTGERSRSSPDRDLNSERRFPSIFFLRDGCED